MIDNSAHESTTQTTRKAGKLSLNKETLLDLTLSADARMLPKASGKESICVRCPTTYTQINCTTG
ncbi:MAG TPA: hypothetical protein VFA07_16630 [Chthonomonadaceae bacterium]|nr:hypothetical protein [Chthonomonadaceae bacterium]